MADMKSLLSWHRILQNKLYVSISFSVFGAFRPVSVFSFFSCSKSLDKNASLSPCSSFHWFQLLSVWAFGKTNDLSSFSESVSKQLIIAAWLLAWLLRASRAFAISRINAHTMLYNIIKLVSDWSGVLCDHSDSLCHSVAFHHPSYIIHLALFRLCFCPFAISIIYIIYCSPPSLTALPLALLLTCFSLVLSQSSFRDVNSPSHCEMQQKHTSKHKLLLPKLPLPKSPLPRLPLLELHPTTEAFY